MRIGCPSHGACRGQGGRGVHFGTVTQQNATQRSRHRPSRLGCDFATNYAAAANWIRGEPTTPLFSITVFISLEPNQVRAFETSAASARTTTSFWSSALRNTLVLVMPADARSFSCPL